MTLRVSKKKIFRMLLEPWCRGFNSILKVTFLGHSVRSQHQHQVRVLQVHLLVLAHLGLLDLLLPRLLQTLPVWLAA